MNMAKRYALLALVCFAPLGFGALAQITTLNPTGSVSITGSLPAGSNNIGSVNVGNTVNANIASPIDGSGFVQVDLATSTSLITPDSLVSTCTTCTAGIFLGQTATTRPTVSTGIYSAPSLTTHKEVRVDGSAVTQPVSIAATISAAVTQPNASLLNVTASTIDPCQSSGVVKSSVAINVSSAATTQLVALVGGLKVYVCGFSMVVSGTTSPTAQFEYGTSASCGAGATALTGTYGAASGGFQTVSESGGITLFAAPQGDALCIVTGGTSPSAQGVVTYVQQ